MLAAVEVIGNRDPQRWVRAAQDYNARYGTLFETLGYFEVVRRRYREADSWYARRARWTAEMVERHRRGRTPPTHRAVQAL